MRKSHDAAGLGEHPELFVVEAFVAELLGHTGLRPSRVPTLEKRSRIRIARWDRAVLVEGSQLVSAFLKRNQTTRIVGLAPDFGINSCERFTIT